MKVLRLVPLALILAACSSIKDVSLSPYRIDVQQGNALEMESVEKLKLGLTRSQVRFLLGTPLLVDPFHANRWDYVYYFRKAGKLTEERRLVLFFEGDALSRIEAEGFPPKGELPKAITEIGANAAPKPVRPVEPAVANPSAQAVVNPAPAVASAATGADRTNSVPIVEVAAPKPEAAIQPQPEPVVKAQPEQVTKAVPAAPPLPAATTRQAEQNRQPASQNSLNETSIVPPLQPETARQPVANVIPAPVSNKPLESVALQAESDISSIKPDVMPESPKASNPVSVEVQINSALQAWAEAWRSRNEEAYFAAYAPNFQPDGGQTREEWEKRRRLLLGVSRKIDLQIDGVAIEMVTEDRAHASFRQFYRSENYQDAVIKQLKFVRVDNLWLIEEEKVLAPIKVKK